MSQVRRRPPEPTSSNGIGYYKIKNVNSGKLLAVSGSSTTAGAQLVQTTDANADSQLWQAVNVD